MYTYYENYTIIWAFKYSLALTDFYAWCCPETSSQKPALAICGKRS